MLSHCGVYIDGRCYPLGYLPAATQALMLQQKQHPLTLNKQKTVIIVVFMLYATFRPRVSFPLPLGVKINFKLLGFISRELSEILKVRIDKDPGLFPFRLTLQQQSQEYLLCPFLGSLHDVESWFESAAWT